MKIDTKKNIMYIVYSEVQFRIRFNIFYFCNDFSSTSILKLNITIRFKSSLRLQYCYENNIN